MNQQRFPEVKVEGVGKVLYRCADCGEEMEPEKAVIDWANGGKAYHPDHLPGENSGR